MIDNRREVVLLPAFLFVLVFISIPVRADLIVGLGSGAGGNVEDRRGADTSSPPFSHRSWPRVNWASYNNSGNAETRPATGDLDGDGRDEVVLGLSAASDGWFEVLDDRESGFAHQQWVRVNWSGYNSDSGATWPVCGDVDGDNKDEIIVGLGKGSNGWMEIKDDAGNSFSHLAWTQVNWFEYTTGSNDYTRPAAGDVDGDDRDELIVGLSDAANGRVEVKEDQSGDFSTMKWVEVNWDNYNSSEGSTHPCAGDVDGDGLDELVLGLGSGSHGWMEIKDDNFSFLDWIRVDWKRYNGGSNDGTRPACGNVKPGDQADEIVVGLSGAGNGWMEVKEGKGAGYSTTNWVHVNWSDYNSSNGETYPVISQVVENTDRGAIDNDLTWPKDRFDLRNTGHQTGTGEMDTVSLKWSFFTRGEVDSTPSVADADADDRREVIVGTDYNDVLTLDEDGTESWRFRTGDVVRSGPAVADIDEDDQPETVVGSNDGNIYAINANGSENWRFSTGENFFDSSPTIADIDADDGKEIIFANSAIFALNADGTVKWKNSNVTSSSNIAIEDIDGDGTEEIVASSNVAGDGVDVEGIFALSGQNGTLEWNASISKLFGTPAITHLDEDGSREIVINSTDGSVFALNADGSQKWNIDLGSEFSQSSAPAIGDIDQDSNLEIVIASGDSNIYALNADGSMKWSFPTRAPQFGGQSPAIANIDGDDQLEVIISSNDNNVYAINADGTELWSYFTGIVSDDDHPTGQSIADLDGDGLLEVVVSSSDGNVYVLDK